MGRVLNEREGGRAGFGVWWFARIAGTEGDGTGGELD